MALWQRELDLRPSYYDTDPDDPDQIRALARLVARKLRALQPFTGFVGCADIEIRRKSLIYEFTSVSKDKNADKDDFNRVMVWLYNWADQEIGRQWPPKKVCWIITEA
jgi:hypothetical protein